MSLLIGDKDDFDSLIDLLITITNILLMQAFTGARNTAGLSKSILSYNQNSTPNTSNNNHKQYKNQGSAS